MSLSLQICEYDVENPRPAAFGADECVKAKARKSEWKSGDMMRQTVLLQRAQPVCTDQLHILLFQHFS